MTGFHTVSGYQIHSQGISRSGAIVVDICASCFETKIYTIIYKIETLAEDATPWDSIQGHIVREQASYHIFHLEHSFNTIDPSHLAEEDN